MVIKWLGHASFCIRLEDETKIIIDPYDKCSFPPYTVDDFISGMTNAKRVNNSEVSLTKESLPSTAQIPVLDHAL